MADPTERDPAERDPAQPDTAQPDPAERDPAEPDPAQRKFDLIDDDDAQRSTTQPDAPAPDNDALTEEERAAREAEEELLWIFQATVFDQAGHKIGRVGQVYLDDQTQAPNWVTVKTGLFGMKEFFIPLDHAERSERRITVPFDRATVLASPRTEVDQNLSPSEEDALYNHYQVEGKTTDVASLDEDDPAEPGQ